ncbi:HlyD family efflux transporter periplasmic adaptor subunit [Altererythrobacter lutimaris]|uniref:HlyD family efflux transporter periplasmic adaptor subunit n=1 Tax=Altererythrobacter lutimaris TaxID=2743979 RepID=A0A850HCZ2_9SPHN|nr:HlyD family efflux transporter periplasmic adaptor subunit [Altererythrobacter lutimaris]NVE94941.1 HlyD family efflux transporter periplasmic adaptor subunit [Altererythrobacter lutimaris]
MNRRLKPAATIVGTIAAALLIFIGWSLWAELDQVTRAPGKVIPFARVQIIQSEQGGSISQIHVREGEQVKAGELLVELDTVQLRAAQTEAQAKVAGLESRMARIEAELFNRPLRFPASLADFPEFTANQQRLFQRRRAALQAQVSTLEQLAQLQQQELDLNLPLVETGDVAMSEIIRMRRAVVETRGEISRIRSQYISDLQTEFTRTEEELASAQQQLARAQDSFEAASLTAPTEGVVKNVQFSTIGGVVRPGEEVLQIVPVGEKLIIETRVSPREIAFVKTGQIARVNFETYDNAIYGSANGEVVFVSPDTLTEQTTNGGAATYYRVNLEVDTSTMRAPADREPIVLQPGMTATAEILTGKSTVWSYITKPILKTVSQSMQER